MKNVKVARILLRRRDPPERKRLVRNYLVVLLALFLAHAYFSNLSSPLKLIPQTFIAMSMGYFVLCISSLRQFKYLAEFIDWPKVIDIAEKQ